MLCCQNNHGAWETLISLEEEGEEPNVAEKSKARKDAILSTLDHIVPQHIRDLILDFDEHSEASIFLELRFAEFELTFGTFIFSIFVESISISQKRRGKIVTSFKYCNFWFCIVLD